MASLDERQIVADLKRICRRHAVAGISVPEGEPASHRHVHAMRFVTVGVDPQIGGAENGIVVTVGGRAVVADTKCVHRIGAEDAGGAA